MGDLAKPSELVEDLIHHAFSSWLKGRLGGIASVWIPERLFRLSSRGWLRDLFYQLVIFVGPSQSEVPHPRLRDRQYILS